VRELGLPVDVPTHNVPAEKVVPSAVSVASKYWSGGPTTVVNVMLVMGVNAAIATQPLTAKPNAKIL
jgi:hypothetical protein